MVLDFVEVVLAANEAVNGVRPMVRVLPDLGVSSDSAGFRRIPPAFEHAQKRHCK
jgi:hypothetical protein